VLAINNLQISENFCWNSVEKLTYLSKQLCDIVKSVLVYMKYLHNIIIKGNLTVTKAIIQQFTTCKFKNFSWSYMDTSDMCSLGFSCAMLVAHIYNSLNNIQGSCLA